MRKRNKRVVLRVPGLLLALKRWMFFVLFEIAFSAFSIVLILGEDTLWRLNFVDNLYTRLNTNTGDVFVFVWVAEFVIGTSVMILWNIGILRYLMDWIDNI